MPNFCNVSKPNDETLKQVISRAEEKDYLIAVCHNHPSGNKQKNIQVMDAFATLKLLPEFKIRAGQFYTPLGYENYDISPKTLETVDFSNIVYRMACRNPYEYNLVDYGRDLGVMIIGEAFESPFDNIHCAAIPGWSFSFCQPWSQFYHR